MKSWQLVDEWRLGGGKAGEEEALWGGLWEEQRSACCSSN